MERGIKKGVMNQIINIFILVLVISVLSGMAFLFISSLKSNVLDATATTSFTTINETGGYLNDTGYRLANATLLGFRGVSIGVVYNGSTGVIPAANYTVTSTGFIYNTTLTDYKTTNLSITYSATYVAPDDEQAYMSVNTTETAGYNVTKYLTILFLALIFGAILVVVLRVILPYINVGQQMGGF